jgi:hypothetical protein
MHTHFSGDFSPGGLALSLSKGNCTNRSNDLRGRFPVLLFCRAPV